MYHWDPSRFMWLSCECWDMHFFVKADPPDVLTWYVIRNNKVILVKRFFKLLMIFVLEQPYDLQN